MTLVQDAMPIIAGKFLHKFAIVGGDESVGVVFHPLQVSGCSISVRHLLEAGAAPKRTL